MKLMGLLLIVIVGLTVLTVAAPPVEAEILTKVFCVDDGSWGTDANWRLDDCDGAGTVKPDTDDHVIIPSGITCEADSSGQNSGDLIVESTAVLNISDGKKVQITGNGMDEISTITGTINLKDDGAKITVNQNDHTFDGTGTIVGQHSGAEISLGSGVTLTNETTIEGMLTIKDTSVFDATFANAGTVNANTSGTLAIITNELDDSAAGVWKVSASGATLKIDIEEGTADVLSDDFEVSNGTLDIDAPGFDTSGTLTFTGGTIDCVGLTVGQRAKFTGS